MLILLHLSDIHFKYEENQILDLDSEIRHELERDLVYLQKELGNFSGVLIGGDIAFSGHKEEYEKASQWISHICKIIGCSEENVLVIPGNHDIDVTKIGKFGRTFRKEMRHSETLDATLKEYISDPNGKKMIFEPLQEFNNFASKYGYTSSDDDNINNFGCMSTADSIHWEKDFKLNDDSILRVFGINSALISNLEDNRAANKLVVSTLQTQFLHRKDQLTYLVLCHHPPQWLLDEDNIDNALVAKAKIHLFGHKHAFVSRTYSGCLRIGAGAVHPDRGQDWEPRFNVLAIEIVSGNERKMKVKVYPRVWDKSNLKFVSDVHSTNEYYEELIALDAWNRTESKGEEQNLPISEAKTEIETTQIYMNASNFERKLVYRFLGLPYHNKLKIATDLGLTKDEDENVINDTQKAIYYYQRAKEKSLLKELWDKVNNISKFDIENPFNKK